ncbi:MAG: TlpA disulfide reductase family protein [Dehalococcoidia bacterium]
MRLFRTKPVYIALTLMSVLVVLTACSSGDGSVKDSGDDGDFVLNIYTGASEVGGDKIAFDELIANDDRPILLNFWAGNCPPCRAEMPALQAAWIEYGEDVLIVGVDIGPYVNLGTYDSGRDLVEEFGITYVTGNTQNRSVVPDWQVQSMPSTFLLNRDGRVHDIVIGAISSSRLDQKLRELIAVNAS